MKKTMLFAASLMLLASCSDENLAPSIVESTTISGSVQANLDYTNDTNALGAVQVTYESVPSGVGFTVTYDSEDLEIHPDPNYDYQEIHIDAALDANGNFSIEVPTIADGVQMTLRVEDFYFDRKIWNNATSPPTKVTERNLYQQSGVYNVYVFPDLEEQITITMY